MDCLPVCSATLGGNGEIKIRGTPPLQGSFVVVVSASEQFRRGIPVQCHIESSIFGKMVTAKLAVPVTHALLQAAWRAVLGQ